MLNTPCQALAQHMLSGMTFGGGKAAGGASHRDSCLDTHAQGEPATASS